MNNRIVAVKWVDSYGCSPSWEAIQDISPKLHFCYSVGWVAQESNDVLVIVPHFSPENSEIGATAHGCGDMTIPKRAIIRISEMQIVHASDCAKHNAPAYPPDQCDCGSLPYNAGIQRQQRS